MNRPAEKITGLAAVGAAIPAAFAGNWEVFTTAVVLGVIPATVTGWQQAGGCQGVYERLRWGRRN